MAIPMRLPALVFAVVIESLNTAVHGFASRHLTNANIDLNKKVPDSTRILEHSETILPSNTTGSRDNETFSCPWEIETCLSLCCPPGQTWLNGSCMGENDIFRISLRNITFINGDGVGELIPDKTYYVFRSDPCDIGWMTTSTTKSFSIFQNGSIFAPEFDEGSPTDFGHYCLTRDPETSEYLAKVCRPWVRRSSFMICCVTLSLLTMLAILIVHAMTSEMRNLHVLIFRSYVIAYIASYAGMLGVLLITERRINIFWMIFFEIGTRYFCGCCVLWMNVMSFDIWRSFRGIRQICFNAKKERRTFMWYNIYAWGSPSILISVVVCITLFGSPTFRIDKTDDSIRTRFSVAVVTIAYLCNIILYISTALNIRRQEKDIADLIEDLRKNYEAHKLRFNFYFKLFVVMGGHVIIWAIFLLHPSHRVMHFVGVIEVSQSVIIFAISIRKVNVKQMVLRQLSGSWISSIIPGKLFVTRRSYSVSNSTIQLTKFQRGDIDRNRIIEHKERCIIGTEID